jgi:Lon protease-like protein
MFPLGSVLLPGAVLPLHVFESRYRQLVQDCIEGDREFGVTLIERGFEVGGGDKRRGIGTIARMVEVAELPDGRYAVICVGTRRFRVQAWLPDDPYPRAEIANWPDLDPDSDDVPRLLDDLAPKVRRILALAVELGDVSADPSFELGDDPLLASYHLVTMSPLGPADRYRLLSCPGPGDRLRLLDELLDDAEAMFLFRLGAGSPESE